MNLIELPSVSDRRDEALVTGRDLADAADERQEVGPLLRDRVQCSEPARPVPSPSALQSAAPRWVGMTPATSACTP